jgi:hypothetical protein
MKFKKLTYSLLSLLAVGSLIVFAADHIDAPAVSGTNVDITDYYAFQSPENNDNLVFVANTQGLLSPSATGDANFNSNTMIQFNIDNSGDNIEDLVIQVIFADGKAYAYGPVQPSLTGLTSGVEFDAVNQISVDITPYGSEANIASENGMKLFAGPRDDPFFMDFAQYNEIIAGNASGFNNPGDDTFAGTNVMSVVVEVPKSALGSSSTINTWVSSKTRIN